MKWHKKGSAGGLWEKWVEWFAVMLLVVGFIIAVFSTSAVITYAMGFISGMIFGRHFYIRRFRLKMPFVIVMIGYFIGFLLGSFYGNYKVVVICFVIGIVLSYWLYSSGYLGRDRYMY